MSEPKCNCAGCQSRRAASAKWVAKNRARRLELNRASKRRARQRLLKSIAEVSDEELDRRALELGA